MKKFVDQSLNEFARRGRPKKRKDPEMEDDWYAADDEFDAPESGPEQIEDIEIEDEVTDAALVKRITRTLDNELKIPEFSRGILTFKLRPSGEVVKGTPMVKMPKGDAYIFKTPEGMKKVKVSNMIIESHSGYTKYVSESVDDYYEEDED